MAQVCEALLKRAHSSEMEPLLLDSPKMQLPKRFNQTKLVCFPVYQPEPDNLCSRLQRHRQAVCLTAEHGLEGAKS